MTLKQKSKPNYTRFINLIKDIFLQALDNKYKDYNDIDVAIDIYDKSYKIDVSQMYEYLPMDFSIMLKLKDLFQTENFNINQWSASGCETCDYGSMYTHSIKVKGVIPSGLVD
jgi:hypothetical protein